MIRLRNTFAGDLGTALFTLLGLAGILYVVYQAILSPRSLLATLVIGVTSGAIYALIALGYTMVYGIIELINFAHGDIFTLGAFIAIPLLATVGLKHGTDFTATVAVLLVLVTVVVMAIIGGINVAIERIAYRPLRNAPRLAPLITAIGMSFIVEGAMYLWKGPVSLRFPDLLPQNLYKVGPLEFGFKDLFVVIAALILVIVLSLFIGRTKLGKAMRATAQDRDASYLMGIDINRTIAATFFIGAALAAAGGVIYGLFINTVRFDLGFSAGLVAFTAAVFGGIGNIEGAALGGLLIGIIRAMTERYISGSWTDVVIFSILIMVLVFRPTGLLGMRVPEK